MYIKFKYYTHCLILFFGCKIILNLQMHPLLHDSEQCKPIVIETLKFLYTQNMEKSNEVDFTNPIARPRVPFEVLFVVGV